MCHVYTGRLSPPVRCPELSSGRVVRPSPPRNDFSSPSHFSPRGPLPLRHGTAYHTGDNRVPGETSVTLPQQADCTDRTPEGSQPRPQDSPWEATGPRDGAKWEGPLQGQGTPGCQRQCAAPQGLGGREGQRRRPCGGQREPREPGGLRGPGRWRGAPTWSQPAPTSSCSICRFTWGSLAKGSSE